MVFEVGANVVVEVKETAKEGSAPKLELMLWLRLKRQ